MEEALVKIFCINIIRNRSRLFLSSHVFMHIQESKITSTSEADTIKSDSVKAITKEGSPPTESAPNNDGQVDSEDSKGLSDIAAATDELKLSESPNKVDDSEAVAD